MVLVPEEQRVLANNNNPDFLHGINVDSPVYALIGSQFGESADENNGKRPTNNAPMIITSAHPGLMLNDDTYWTSTYGASHDAYLTIIPGKKIQETIDEIQIESIYKDGLSNADDDNLWKKANDIQQIQYIVSKDDIDSASSAVDTFGDVSEARGLGIRLPGIAGGWGKTIDLLPTDPEPTDDPQGRKNDDAHKLARETWKYGILDARWDYRRGVWAAYNDLITDQYDQSIGTWVFGTNPDTNNGFPFLRGRLDDVWWVRQPLDLADKNGRTEGEQTGRIMTHLKHEWFDEDENGSAPLDSIFIIPHDTSTDPSCHEKEGEHTLGLEKTGDSMKIDIKTGAHFFKEPGVDGPVDFGRNIQDLTNVCCEHDQTSFWFTGEMVFVPKDFQRDVCAGPPGSVPSVAISSDDSEEECKWQPAIQIDECELVGEHFLTLVNNDQQVALMVCALCDEIKAWSEQLIGVVIDNDAILLDKIDKTQSELERAVKELSKCIVDAVTIANNLNNGEKTRVDKVIDQLVCQIFGDATVIDGEVFNTQGLTGEINDKFLECCGSEGDLPETIVSDANGVEFGQTIADDGSPVVFDSNTAKVSKPFVVSCPPGVAISKPFECNVDLNFGSSRTLGEPDPFENCPTVDLKTPCGEPEMFTVDCEVPVSTILSTEFGNCQTHESP